MANAKKITNIKMSFRVAKHIVLERIKKCAYDFRAPASCAAPSAASARAGRDGAGTLGPTAARR